MQALDIRLNDNSRINKYNMRTILSTIMCVFCLIAMAQNEPIAVADGNKITIQTSAICEMCKEALEYDMAFEKGVKEATLNLDDKVLTILYNPKKTDAEKLRERITKVGYHADWQERDSVAYEKLPFCCRDGSHGTSIPQLPTKKSNE